MAIAVPTLMRVGVMAAGLWALLGATTAWASDDDYTAARSVPVTLTSTTPHVSWRVEQAKTKLTVATCSGTCSFEAPPGKYQVHTADDQTGAQNDFGIDTRQARVFRLYPDNAAAKRTGLELGIPGMVLMGAGVVLMVPWAFQVLCEHPQDHEGLPPPHCGSSTERTVGIVGLGVGALGGILTAVGWTMFGHNRNRLVEVHRDDGAAPSGFQLRVGVGSFGPGAYGFAGVGRF